jgi:SAM-dependent methyltransferase
MDEVAQFNKERWEALARAGIQYARPMLDMDVDAARRWVDPYGVMGDVRGADVLCLAGGGGQQSAAFALLGATVTVIDLSEMQLARDREAAAHYGVSVRTLQGDMRDLGTFADGAFDLVYHAHSMNFVPDTRPVYDEVRRVLCSGGLYRMSCSNPFTMGLDESEWDGKGYPLHRTYVDGAKLVFDDPHWEFEDGEGAVQRVRGPHEYRHTLSTLLNGLVEHGFVLLGVWEEGTGQVDAAPGTWDHMQSVAPPFLSLWAAYRPDVFAGPRCSSSG